MYALHTDGQPIIHDTFLVHVGSQKRRVCPKLYLGCGCDENGPLELFGLSAIVLFFD